MEGIYGTIILQASQKSFLQEQTCLKTGNMVCAMPGWVKQQRIHYKERRLSRSCSGVTSDWGPLPEKLILGSLCARTWIYLQYLDMAVAALPRGEETEQNEPATIDNDDQDDHYIAWRDLMH